MDPAAVFFVAMNVIQLGTALLENTTPQLREPIGESDVHIEGVELVGDGGRLRHVKFKALQLIRRSHEKPKVFRHLPLHLGTEVHVKPLLDNAFIETASRIISAEIEVDHEQVIVVTIHRAAEHDEILREDY